MESSDHYNFSLFKPRNLHGKKNRNVILTMLLIWATAVFGFQVLLKTIEKPVPEKSLVSFESAWPSVVSGNPSGDDLRAIMQSLILVKGKNTVKPGDQAILADAINSIFFKTVPDSVKAQIISGAANLKSLAMKLAEARGQEYLDISSMIVQERKALGTLAESFTGYKQGSLEIVILVSTLGPDYPESLSDSSLSTLPDIMKLYLTHNQSKLTDTKLLGFPFHYLYTAIFLLVIFIALCIIYNILIEWRLRKEGIVE